MIKKIILVLLSAFVSVSVHAWDLNDVTYIMPLPKSDTKNNLLRIYNNIDQHDLLTTGQQDLISKEVIGQIPKLVMAGPQADIIESMRLMSLRIDPCFPLPTPQSCQKQIRMVWQPIVLGRNFTVTTIDAALHSFYVLDENQFKLLIADLQNWKKQFAVVTENLPLQIHPAWKEDGDSAKSLTAFNQLILKYAGLQNLTRVTSMLLRGSSDIWIFSALDITNGQIKQNSIPRLGDGEAFQNFVNRSVQGQQFDRAQMKPAPKDPNDNLNFFIGNILFGQITEKQLQESMQIALRIENPNFFNPETMDCVNCHLAQPVREWLMNENKNLMNPIDYSEQMKLSEYKNDKYNLENKSTRKLNTQQLRALGYMGTDLAISQRTINESAEVAEALNNYLAD